MNKKKQLCTILGAVANLWEMNSLPEGTQKTAFFQQKYRVYPPNG
jgi:hypothetical protein